MTDRRILVVDDDQLVCWALEKEFVGIGLSTRVVENGADALAELRRQPHDVVFLDINLPDANGIDLLREIEKVSPEAIVIVMSGDASDTNRQRAFNGGAVQFLEKPFDLSEVRGILMSTSGHYPQKRKHPRRICSIPLRISIADPAPEVARYDLQNLIGTMADVGSGGIRLRTEYPLRVGQIVRVHGAPGNDPALDRLPRQAAAEVVWVDPAQDAYTAGLKFLSC